LLVVGISAAFTGFIAMGVIAIDIAVMIGIVNLSIAVSPLCGINCWFPFSSLSYPPETIYF
jgi:hypothetical protein